MKLVSRQIEMGTACSRAILSLSDEDGLRTRNRVPAMRALLGPYRPRRDGAKESRCWRSDDSNVPKRQLVVAGLAHGVPARLEDPILLVSVADGAESRVLTVVCGGGRARATKERRR